MVIPPLIGNPYNGYINPYYWVDDHPLLYGNNGSLDPGTPEFLLSDKTSERKKREISDLELKILSSKESMFLSPVLFLKNFFQYFDKNDLEDHQKVPCKISYRHHAVSRKMTKIPKRELRACWGTNILGDPHWGRYTLPKTVCTHNQNPLHNLSMFSPHKKKKHVSARWDTKEVSTCLHCTQNQRIFQQMSIQCSQMHRQKFRWCCQKQ